MVELKELFQTLEDRNNPDEIENQGPFKCRKKAWLGEGYYFWDTFIELAHWWGKQGYRNNYVICKICYDYDPAEIFDLVGNTNQLREFREYSEILSEALKKEITVPFIIEHMKRHIKSFPYKAIRAYGIDSVKHDYKLRSKRVKFTPANEAYVDLCPAIQICFFDKKYLGNYQFKIIYPDTYCQDYTI